MEKRVKVAHKQLELSGLLTRLGGTLSLYEKLDLLNELPEVREFMRGRGPVQTFLQGLTPECDYAIKAIIAIGQAPILFRIPQNLPEPMPRLRAMLEILLEVESAYSAIGGIIGYHAKVLDLLQAEPYATEQETLRQPVAFSLSEASPELDAAIEVGIEQLPLMGELYPIGGAGDRLNLRDPTTGEPLPCAKLPFCGRSLLEGMLRDLQAREYLHEKRTGNRVVTPVALMTSLEKNNDAFIREILEESDWMGRPKESFFFFLQPGVPVITEEGNWSLSAPLTLFTKPGGHGVMWKLAEEAGLFDWFAEKGRTKVLVRQVNNPIAGTDHGLLAFTGYGIKNDKQFGFASCDRLIGAPEGMDVVIQKEKEEGVEVALTNIEYTDFARHGLQEEPREPGSRYSVFPANTNILFADLEAVRRVAQDCPIPGMLINMKKKVPFLDEEGKRVDVLGGRLESTMQNIADHMVSRFTTEPDADELLNLPVFLTENRRRKTISVTKQSFMGGSLVGTPEGAFDDLIENNRELLRSCGVAGDKLWFLFHPALGPLYSGIREKIRGGDWAEGSELLLEIADAEIDRLDLDGSVLVEATQPLAARVSMKNVVVRNRGLADRRLYNWGANQTRDECARIILHGDAEFIAEDVVLAGNCEFEVPAGKRLVVTGGEKLKLEWVDR